MHVLRQKGRGRKKKKSRKKHLPRSPRPQQGCRRLCDHQRQVPVVRIPVMMQRQVPTVHSFMLPVQFLDTVLDMPVVVLRQVLRSLVPKTVVFPQLQSIGGRLPSFVPQRQIPMVQTVQQTTEIPQMPFVFRWSMPLLCRFCASQVVYLRTQRTAWFDSGYMRCVSLRSVSFSTCMVDCGTSGRFSTCSSSAFAWFNSEYKFMRPSTWLVFLVTMHLALYSFVVLRPLMLDIMAGMDHVAGLPGHDAPRAVFLRCPQAQDARLHGRHGPRRFTGAVLGQGSLLARCCVMCGASVQTVLYTVWRFRSCSSSWSSTLPFYAQWQSPMVLFAQKTIEIPQFVFGGRCPCLQVFHRCNRGWTVQTHSCSRCHSALCRPASSTGAVCEKTVEIPLLLLHAGFAVH